MKWNIDGALTALGYVFMPIFAVGAVVNTIEHPETLLVLVAVVLFSVPVLVSRWHHEHEEIRTITADIERDIDDLSRRRRTPETHRPLTR